MDTDVFEYMMILLACAILMLPVVFWIDMRRLKTRLRKGVKIRVARRFCVNIQLRTSDKNAGPSAQQQKDGGAPVALLSAPRFTVGEIAQFLLPEWHERAAEYHGRLLIVTHVSADGDLVDGYLLPAERHARVTKFLNIMASDLRATGGRAVEVLDLDELREHLGFLYKVNEEPWLNAGEIYKCHRARTTSLI